MTTIDRIILGLLAGGVWALVALQIAPPAVATTQPAEMPLQSVFNQYLTTAITQAKSAANGSSRSSKDIGGNNSRRRSQIREFSRCSPRLPNRSWPWLPTSVAPDRVVPDGR